MNASGRTNTYNNRDSIYLLLVLSKIQNKTPTEWISSIQNNLIAFCESKRNTHILILIYLKKKTE